MRTVYKAPTFKRRYRASRALGHVVNFARGLAIGSIIALLVWLMVG